MERLYTSITNKEQNNNYLQTGRTGEREDFMRENLFMTETFEAPVRIALDHGWSSIKGEHTFMETSVVPVEYTPLTNHFWNIRVRSILWVRADLESRQLRPRMRITFC